MMYILPASPEELADKSQPNRHQTPPTFFLDREMLKLTALEDLPNALDEVLRAQPPPQ